jgi:hypothetical protein
LKETSREREGQHNQNSRKRLENLAQSSDRLESSPTPKDFLLDCYIACQEELVRYGVRFDHTIETSEDLMADCHEMMVRKYPKISQKDYIKYMKISMKNRFIDHFRRTVWLESNQYPESISPKPLMALDEKVCQKEELGFLRLAISRMSSTDQDILLEQNDTLVVPSYRKYQAIKRLERNIIEVMGKQKMKHLQEQTEQEKLQKEGKR